MDHALPSRRRSGGFVPRITALWEAYTAGGIRKDDLPAVQFSGTSNARGNAAVTPTGRVCLDYDHVTDPRSLLAVSWEWPETELAFLSPRGHGVKVVVRYPCEWHEVRKWATERFGGIEGFDRTFANLDRLCYLPARSGG